MQNFVLKVYIVITSEVFADFRFESPISIDFQNEILALLLTKSANIFAPKVCQNFALKFYTYRTFKAKVCKDFGGNNYIDF